MFDKEAYLKRANPEKLKEIFNKYASLDENGERHMSIVTFLTDFLEYLPKENYDRETVRMLGSIVNAKRTGTISYSEFEKYEEILTYPDNIYRSLFRMCGGNNNDRLSYGDFRNFYNNTELATRYSFDWESPFVSRYFGKDKAKSLNYCEFAGFVHDFFDQISNDAFKQADKEGSGYISVDSFRNIVLNIRKFQITPDVLHILNEGKDIFQLDKAGGSQRKISFAYFKAFNDLLKNLEVAKQVYMDAAHKHTNTQISESQFLFAVQNLGISMSPLEIQILFQFCDLIHHKKKLIYQDFQAISPPHYYVDVGHHAHGDVAVAHQGILWQMLQVVYRITLGLVAGGTGATAVFPIDLVKTRIQNQRTDPRMEGSKYKGYFDCFFKVLFGEGFFGLYRGLLPQVIGVSPEKAMKLTVNDGVRDYFTEEGGKIKFRYEVLAGVCAGCSQVVITCPLEIIKIRLQTAGEVAGGHKVKARQIIRDLGIRGIYKGIKPCLMRDATFAGIYFSMYAYFKRLMADKNQYNHPMTFLAAGLCAGAPAAFFATPFDVIKTRMQVIPREGQTTYDIGVIDTTQKIYRQEGLKAFTKGALARVCRSAPQMAITLFTYEVLQRLLYFDFGGKPTAGSAQAVQQYHTHTHTINPDNIGGYVVANAVFRAMENRFGMHLPKTGQKNRPQPPKAPDSGEQSPPSPSHADDDED